MSPSEDARMVWSGMVSRGTMMSLPAGSATASWSAGRVSPFSSFAPKRCGTCGKGDAEAQRREAAARGRTTLRVRAVDGAATRPETASRPVRSQAWRGPGTPRSATGEAGSARKASAARSAGARPGPERTRSRLQKERGADAGRRRLPEAEGGRSTQKGISSSKSSVDAGAPPAGMAPPFAGSVAGAAAAWAPLPLAPFGLSRNCTL